MAKRSRHFSDVDAGCFVFRHGGGINSPNANVMHFHTTCWLWVSLFAVLLLSSRAYSANDTSKSEEGKCRYDLTSVAAISCMQPDGVWRPPSQTCCNALLYAIDKVPARHESGACCLCRYMKEKVGPPKLAITYPGLATTYVLCNGKDKLIISNWSSFPMECIAECTKTSIPILNRGTFANEDNDTPVVGVNGRYLLQ